MNFFGKGRIFTGAQVALIFGMVKVYREQEQSIKQDHFANILDGETVELTQIILDTRATLEAKAEVNAKVIRSILAIPSQQFLIAKNAAAKLWKAISEN